MAMNLGKRIVRAVFSSETAASEEDDGEEKEEEEEDDDDGKEGEVVVAVAVDRDRERAEGRCTGEWEGVVVALITAVVMLLKACPPDPTKSGILKLSNIESNCN